MSPVAPRWGGDFPSYRSQAVQYGEPAGLPLADQPARHLPAFPVSQLAALQLAQPSPVFYSSQGKPVPVMIRAKPAACLPSLPALVQ